MLPDYDGVGVADLVQEAGITLGSFYGSFESRPQLVATACSNANNATDRLLSESLSTAEKDTYRSTADRYLSVQHRNNFAGRCVPAALGGEIAHQPAGVRSQSSPALETLFDNLAVKVPGKPPNSDVHSLYLPDEVGEERCSGFTSLVPPGRMTEPLEIAKAVQFLGSDESSYVTGIELFVDGGMAQV